MRSYRNSFRIRAAEFNTEVAAFCDGFALDMLDFLPESFDVPVILRSPPGAGKTSLMRILAAPWLAEIVGKHQLHSDLHAHLRDRNVLSTDGKPLLSGTLIKMNSDVSALLDIGAPAAIADRLFKRLLDARILAGHLAAIRTLAESISSMPVGSADVALRVPSDRLDLVALTADIIDRKPDGIVTGSEIQQWAVAAERQVRGLLNDLRPVDWNNVDVGPDYLISLRLLAVGRFAVQGRELNARAITFLDDVHELRPPQRSALLGLVDRRGTDPLRLWIAERDEALSDAELLGDAEGRGEKSGEQGRDYTLIRLTTSRNAVKGGSYERALRSVANRRANADIQTYADTVLTFLELLDRDATLPDDEYLPALHARLDVIVDPRFSEWATWLQAQTGHGAAVICRAGLALIEAIERRAQAELPLGLPRPLVDLEERLTSKEREAAALALRREFDKRPVYFGSSALIALANENISQLLRVSADLFDQILSAITRRRSAPTLSPADQDRIIRKTSGALWDEIPRRLANGRDVQSLIHRFAQYAQRINASRPISYAPGISGWAIRMRDVDVLNDPSKRGEITNGDRVLKALSAAIAHDYLTVFVAKRGPKEERRMVFYVNRLLCPRFELPLGRGGYRTRPLTDLAAWVADRRGREEEAINSQEDLFGDW